MGLYILVARPLPITPDQLVPTIDVDVILVTIAILAVLPHPTHRRFLLLALGRIVVLGIGLLTALDLLIVVTKIVLNGNRVIEASNDLGAH